MPFFPHSWLSVASSWAVVISGPHIQTLDKQTGDVVASTAFSQGKDKDDLLKSGPVRCAATDTYQKYLATVGDDKILKVWDLETLKLLSQRELPKKPTAVHFTVDSQTILVSDKFGDVFSYPLHPQEVPPILSEPKLDETSSHDNINSSGGTLVLGHASVLTSFLLTFDEKYIITADRDEHIRVSWFPHGYNIERYCLGHSKYVTAIHIPHSQKAILISGGGDPMLKFWNWMSGAVVHEVEVLETVLPYIKVKPSKQRWSEVEGNPPNAPQGKGKRKDKGHTKVVEIDTGAGTESGPMHEETSTISGHEGGQPAESSNAASANSGGDKESGSSGDVVLVIHKIDTLQSGGSLHVIFSAVGATALFWFLYPGGNGTSKVQALNLGVPVLDFVVSEDGCIWTLLDSAGTMIRIVELVEDKLVERVDQRNSLLLSSLNTRCLLEADTTELQTLHLYDLLYSMPKNADVEHNPMDRNEADLHGEALQEQPISKKQLGRLKSKKALLAQTLEAGKLVEEDGGPQRKRRKSTHVKSSTDE